MIYDYQGIAKCGIEQAFHAGKTDFKNPYPATLYPIRASIDERVDMQRLNYDRWRSARQPVIGNNSCLSTAS